MKPNAISISPITRCTNTHARTIYDTHLGCDLQNSAVLQNGIKININRTDGQLRMLSNLQVRSTGEASSAMQVMHEPKESNKQYLGSLAPDIIGMSG